MQSAIETAVAPTVGLAVVVTSQADGLGWWIGLIHLGFLHGVEMVG